MHVCSRPTCTGTPGTLSSAWPFRSSRSAPACLPARPTACLCVHAPCGHLAAAAGRHPFLWLTRHSRLASLCRINAAAAASAAGAQALDELESERGQGVALEENLQEAHELTSREKAQLEMRSEALLQQQVPCQRRAPCCVASASPRPSCCPGHSCSCMPAAARCCLLLPAVVRSRWACASGRGSAAEQQADGCHARGAARGCTRGGGSSAL